jgi:hypothetical protein
MPPNTRLQPTAAAAILTPPRLKRRVGWKKKEPERRRRTESKAIGRAVPTVRPASTCQKTTDGAPTWRTDAGGGRSGKSTTTKDTHPTGRSTRLARLASCALAGERQRYAVNPSDHIQLPR